MSGATETNNIINLLDEVKAKPGYLTTEFWKNLIFNVFAVLTAVGQIKPTGNPRYDQWIQLAAWASGAVSNIGYFKSRADTKSAATHAKVNTIYATQGNPVVSVPVDPDEQGGV